MADLVLAVTERDRAQILEHVPGARVAVIPNVHEVRDHVPSHAERRRNSLLFVGGFAHPPNVDAVRFFCGEILPLVRQRLGLVDVTVVGARPPREIADLAGDGVVVAGWVPDLTPHLDCHAAAIAPLRFGAGMKGKIGQALASGLPVVTTSVGAEGMDLEDGKTALVADAPQAFADAVARLCTDPRLHGALSRAGRDHVRGRWDVRAVDARLREVIESLRGLGPRPLTRCQHALAWLAGMLARMVRVLWPYRRRPRR
jgi:glycosyltransferase involved in cell wall biosynthesis